MEEAFSFPELCLPFPSAQTLLIPPVTDLFTVSACTCVCVCLRTAAVKLQRAGNFSGPHEQLIRLSLPFWLAGLSVVTVCSPSFNESRSDR